MSTYKPYDPNFKKPENGRKVNADCAVIKHKKAGMDCSKYPCSIVSAGETVTITIPELKTSISVLTEDINKLLEPKGDT